ncbi:MAG: hypothetical protein P8Y65_00470 [Campylobacterales bacterium]
MFDRIMTMFDTVANGAHGSVALVFVIGILFGGIIQYARVDKFEKIAGFAMLRDTVVPKMLFLAVGLASIGLYFMIEAGYAHYHIKPILLEGRIDVMVGAFGGLVGGLVFTVFYDPFFKKIMGPDLGSSTLTGIAGESGALVILVFGLALVAVSILIPLRQEFDEADLKQLD